MKSFIQTLKENKKKSIAIMESGGAIAAGFWKKNVDAILVSFYGGEQMAPGMFNIIYG